ncbi:MAG: transporter [Betaproteobacteria bacterium]|nr:transporter [Betaproteobacteria bacterium]
MAGTFSSPRPGGALATLFLLPATAWAFQPLVTDDTGTQGAAGNEIEVAYNRTSSKSPGTKDITHEVPLEWTRGITDALDLSVGLSRQRIVPTAPATAEHGWSNTFLGAKWRFYDDEPSKLSFALKPEIQFPVSRDKEVRGLGTARTSYSVGLLMTQETGLGAVHANLMAARVNYADDVLNLAERRTLYRLSVAPVWDVAENWKLALDAGLMTNPDRAAKARMGYVELGVIYSPSTDLDFALGIVRDIRDGNARTTQVTLGVTGRFR